MCTKNRTQSTLFLRKKSSTKDLVAGSKSVLGDVVINTHSEVLGQLLGLVLFAAVAVLVGKAEIAVATYLAELFGLLGLVKTRHDCTS
jgi:hypothetical protein